MAISINNASRIFNSDSHLAFPKPYMVCLSCGFPFDLSLSSIPTLLSAVTTISPSDGVISLCVFVRYDAVPDTPLSSSSRYFKHLSL